MWLWQLWFVFLIWVAHKSAEEIYLRSENEVFNMESADDNVVDFTLPDTFALLLETTVLQVPFGLSNKKGNHETIGKEVDDYDHCSWTGVYWSSVFGEIGYIH